MTAKCQTDMYYIIICALSGLFKPATTKQALPHTSSDWWSEQLETKSHKSTQLQSKKCLSNLISANQLISGLPSGLKSDKEHIDAKQKWYFGTLYGQQFVDIWLLNNLF